MLNQIKRKCIYSFILERKSIVVDIKIKNTMPKECAAIVIINMEELKNLGTVLMRSFMLTECAKIAISIHIIEKEENREMKRLKKAKYKVS